MLDNLSTGDIHNIIRLVEGDLEFIEGDIYDVRQCVDACEGIDYILHQAALGSVPRSIKEPVLYFENNVEGTLNLLYAAKSANVKRFVFASSSSVYGGCCNQRIPKDEYIGLSPLSPYAISKQIGENYCQYMNVAYGLPVIILRYFNVFGPRQDPNSEYSAVIPKFIDAALRHRTLTINGLGNHKRDFTYVDNVVQANLSACNIDEFYCGNVYNVATGNSIDLNYLAKTILKETKSRANILYGPAREGDVLESFASIKRSVGHDIITDITHFHAGIKETIAWYAKKLKEK